MFDIRDSLILFWRVEQMFLKNIVVVDAYNYLKIINLMNVFKLNENNMEHYINYSCGTVGNL